MFVARVKVCSGGEVRGIRYTLAVSENGEKSQFNNVGGPFRSRSEASRGLRYVRDMFGLSDRSAKVVGAGLFLLSLGLATAFGR